MVDGSVKVLNMKTALLPHTDLEFSALGLGCWALVPSELWGEQEEADSINAIHTALDLGINWFDTAPAYGDGESEKLVGKALKGRSARVATKVLARKLTGPAIIESCHASLRRLDMDCIDLYQIHWPGEDHDYEAIFEAFLRLQDEGKIKAVGVSNFGPGDMARIDPLSPAVATNQLCYNLLFRAVEFEILPAMEKRGMGALCYSPLAQGLLTGKFRTADEVPEGRARTRHFSSERPLARHGEEGAEELTFQALEGIRQLATDLKMGMDTLALGWLLAQRGVASVIAGVRTPEQVSMNVQAAEAGLDRSTLAQLSELTRPLKERLGPNADPWQGESRIG